MKSVYNISSINDSYLMHHGIKGQKWGTRRYQNEDGSLTPEGAKRYGAKYSGVIKTNPSSSSNAHYEGVIIDNSKSSGNSSISGVIKANPNYNKGVSVTGVLGRTSNSTARTTGVSVTGTLGERVNSKYNTKKNNAKQLSKIKDSDVKITGKSISIKGFDDSIYSEKAKKSAYAFAAESAEKYRNIDRTKYYRTLGESYIKYLQKY